MSIRFVLRLSYAALLMAVPLTAQEQLGRRVTHFEAPQFPRMARQMRVEGEVRFMLKVDQKGKVEAVKVIDGPKVLAGESISETLKHWEFESSKNAHDDVEVMVEFRLSGTPSSEACTTSVTAELPGKVIVMANPGVAPAPNVIKNKK